MNDLRTANIFIQVSAWQDFQARKTDEAVLFDLILRDAPCKLCPIPTHTGAKLSFYKKNN